MLALLCIWEVMHLTKVTIVTSKPSYNHATFPESYTAWIVLAQRLYPICPDRNHYEHNPYLGRNLDHITTITMQPKAIISRYCILVINYVENLQDVSKMLLYAPTRLPRKESLNYLLSVNTSMTGMCAWKDEEPIRVACTMLIKKKIAIYYVGNRPIWYWTI